MSAPIPSCTSFQPGVSLPQLSLAIPQGNSMAIISHVKTLLTDPSLSQADLETLVDNLLVVANDKRDLSQSFLLWSELPNIVEGSAPQTDAFLRILGRKYYDSYPYAIEALLKKLTTPAHLQAFLDGLKINQGPTKGRWHAERYALAMVDSVLKSEGLNPGCISVLQRNKEGLQAAVESLPQANAPDLLDFRAIAAQERELMTPKKRVVWGHIMKMYSSNLKLTQLSAMANGSGVCLGYSSTDGLLLKNCVLKLLKKQDLSRTGVFKDLKVLENSPLPSPLSAQARDADIMQLLDRSFYPICAMLTDADKEIICKEMEKLILETIFKSAFESTMGTCIDDREEGWFPLWHQNLQYSGMVSLDVCPVNAFQQTKCLKTFKLWLKQAEGDDQIESPTHFVLQYRGELIEKTMAELLATLASI